VTTAKQGRCDLRQDTCLIVRSLVSRVCAQIVRSAIAMYTEECVKQWHKCEQLLELALHSTTTTIIRNSFQCAVEAGDGRVWLMIGSAGGEVLMMRVSVASALLLWAAMRKCVWARG
jgi:hypothetical protein